MLFPNERLFWTCLCALVVLIIAFAFAGIHLIYAFSPPEYYIAQHGSEAVARWVSVGAVVIFGSLTVYVVRRHGIPALAAFATLCLYVVMVYNALRRR